MATRRDRLSRQQRLALGRTGLRGSVSSIRRLWRDEEAFRGNRSKALQLMNVTSGKHRNSRDNGYRNFIRGGYRNFGGPTEGRLDSSGISII